MKPCLAKVLVALAMVGAMVFGGDRAVATPAAIPVVGVPFVSGNFIGSVEIKQFRTKGNRIVADTVLRQVGKKAVRATLPVKISRSSCKVLELRVGPLEGSSYPVVISERQGSSNVSDSTFCAIGAANGVKEQVAVLNGDTGLAGGVNSCGIIEVIRCAAASATCASACFAGPAACIACFAGVGLPNCYDCF